MADKTHQERAIAKTQLEIDKDIKDLVEIAKNCGIGELLNFVHFLHFVRLIQIFGEIPENEKKLTQVYVHQSDEVYKYLIQVLYKFSQKQFVKNKVNDAYINPFTTLFLVKSVIGINSKHEALNFFTLTPDMEVSGERDETIKVNLQSIINEEKSKLFLYYGVRVSRENNSKKSEIKIKEDFLEYFKAVYAPYTDLFLNQFGLGLDKFILLIDFILTTVVEQMKQNEKKCVTLQDGNVDIQAYQTIINFGLSFFIQKQVLFEKFGLEIEDILNRLTFNSAEFDENQLRFNLIARKPLLDFGNRLLVSPEILLDSLIVNSHYSLLEDGDSTNEYKKRYSSKFIDEIVQVANKYGYFEVAREMDLHEGRNQIGDIDIVLKNNSNHFLLIEAKNHSLPLDVYFHDYSAIEKRLIFLTKEWEAKVEKRFKHLQSKSSNYNIPSTFNYIIVTSYPEILSHYSNFLVLSIREFDYWLKQNKFSMKFEDIFEAIYKPNESPYTKEQMEKLHNDLAIGWKFEK